jgi:hypothetical protein
MKYTIRVYNKFSRLDFLLDLPEIEKHPSFLRAKRLKRVFIRKTLLILFKNSYNCTENQFSNLRI